MLAQVIAITLPTQGHDDDERMVAEKVTAIAEAQAAAAVEWLPRQNPVLLFNQCRLTRR